MTPLLPGDGQSSYDLRYRVDIDKPSGIGIALRPESDTENEGMAALLGANKQLEYDAETLVIDALSYRCQVSCDFEFTVDSSGALTELKMGPYEAPKNVHV